MIWRPGGPRTGDRTETFCVWKAHLLEATKPNLGRPKAPIRRSRGGRSVWVVLAVRRAWDSSERSLELRATYGQSELLDEPRATCRRKMRRGRSSRRLRGRSSPLEPVARGRAAAGSPRLSRDGSPRSSPLTTSTDDVVAEEAIETPVVDDRIDEAVEVDVPALDVPALDEASTCKKCTRKAASRASISNPPHSSPTHSQCATAEDRCAANSRRRRLTPAHASGQMGYRPGFDLGPRCASASNR